MYWSVESRLMLRNRGCRSHASRWGLYSWDPEFARSRARPSLLSFSRSFTCLFSHRLLPPPFSCVHLLFSLFALCFSLSLSLVPHFSRTSVITYMEGGGTVYQTRPKRVFVVPCRELMRKTFYTQTHTTYYFVGKRILRLLCAIYVSKIEFYTISRLYFIFHSLFHAITTVVKFK